MDGRSGPRPGDPARSPDRERLLDAARRAFAAGGYRATSLRDVAQYAGVDVMTLRESFSAKADLVYALYDRLLADQAPLRGRLRTVLADSDDDGLLEWLDSALTWWDRNLDLIGTVREAGVVDTGIARVMGEKFEASLDDASSAFRTLPPDQYHERRSILQLLMMQLDQIYLAWLTGEGGAMDRRRVVDRVAAAWILLFRR